MELRFSGVNPAFYKVVQLLAESGVSTPSRAGDVLRYPEPLLLSYSRPTERVLFSQTRDANPFFHLYEAIWMLAGRDDVGPLAWYNGKIAEVASDDGQTFNGAYGKRWRWPTDQLLDIIRYLRGDRNGRRAVLAMWNVRDDLAKIHTSKDVCCNTHIYFSIRDNTLEMTVCNRSNDLLWGMLGANFVHFTLLQEYVAGFIGVPVGTYHHFTNDVHVYKERFDPEAIRKERFPNDIEERDVYPFYGYIPLFAPVQGTFAYMYDSFNDAIAHVATLYNTPVYYHCPFPFINHVVRPMQQAFYYHKMREYTQAYRKLESVAAADWRLAGYQWISKREQLWKSKNPYGGM